MGQDVTVQFLAELSAKRTPASATDQPAEDGTGHRSKGDADWAGKGADGRTGLTSSQCSADATGSTTDGADGSANFHGVMERSDFGGVTARALQ